MYLKRFSNDGHCIGKKGICPSAFLVLAGGLLTLPKTPGHTSNLTVVVLEAMAASSASAAVAAATVPL